MSHGTPIARLPSRLDSNRAYSNHPASVTAEYLEDPSGHKCENPNSMRAQRRIRTADATTTDMETNMRRFLTAGAATALVVSLWGCSGGGYSTGNGATPTSPTSASSAGVVTVNVVAINGAQSFSPNPATLPAGQMIVWHNVDTTTHRVVLNDGSVDTGNLAAGASSRPMAIRAAGGAYHCAIHPEMVGSVNQDTPAPTSPPSAGGY
jgi:plastocyanin